MNHYFSNGGGGGVPDLVKKLFAGRKIRKKIVCRTSLKKKNCLHRKLKGKKLFSKQFLKETFPYDVLYEFRMYALILQQELLWILYLAWDLYRVG